MDADEDGIGAMTQRLRCDSWWRRKTGRSLLHDRLCDDGVFQHRISPNKFWDICFAPVGDCYVKRPTGKPTYRLVYQRNYGTGALFPFFALTIGHRDVSQAGAEIEAVRAGRADLQNQSRPSGIVPDYVLVCELTGFDEKGVEALMKTKTITTTLTLHDLRSRGVAWAKSQVGGMGEGLVFLDGLLFSLGSSDDEDLREAISATVQHALQTNPPMPQVPGFERYKGPKP